MATNRDQAYNRQAADLYDQFNREWDGMLDTTARPMSWCTPLIPRFKAPIIPPLKYLKPGKRLGEVNVDCAQWLNDIDDRTQEVEHILTKLAEDMEPNRLVEAIEKPTVTMLKFLGPRGLHRDFVLAMMAGNSWVLGFSDKEPAWLTDEHRASLKSIKPRGVRSVSSDELARFRDDSTEDVDSSVAADAELERFLDLDDTHDPHALGGTRVPVNRRRRGPRTQETAA